MTTSHILMIMNNNIIPNYDEVDEKLIEYSSWLGNPLTCSASCFSKNSFRQIEIGDFWTLITSSLNLIAFIEFNRHHCILFKSGPLLKSNCDQVHYDSVKKRLSTWTRRLIGDTMNLTIKWFFWRVNSRQVLYFNDLR